LPYVPPAAPTAPDPSVPEAAPTAPAPPADAEELLSVEDEVPTYVSSGDLLELSASGGNPVLPERHRVAFWQAVAVTVLVALAILGVRVMRS
jgi:hypothetical protein